MGSTKIKSELVLTCWSTICSATVVGVEAVGVVLVDVEVVLAVVDGFPLEITGVPVVDV